ncbi:MAG: putative metal-binding motif-containing protein [Thermoanaerobaculia bacterium]
MGPSSPLPVGLETLSRYEATALVALKALGKSHVLGAVRPRIVPLTLALFLAGTALSSRASAGSCVDNDGDGYGFPGDASCPAGPEEDCNDSSPVVNPGHILVAADVGDGIDNDCDGFEECFEDLDNDGFGVPLFVQDNGDGVCQAIDGESVVSTDCRDDRADIFPGAVISAADIDDGEDDDCDGADRDECWLDADGDGFGAPPAVQDDGDEMCLVASNESLVDSDCNDADLAINPDATEVCDGIDNNCSGAVDEGVGPGDTMVLKDDTVIDLQVFEVCGTIEIGSNSNVSGPAGHLMLKAGRAIFKDGASVGTDAALTVEIVPP